MAQRILRPLNYGDLLDEVFDLYRRHFLVFAGIAGLLHIPLQLAVSLAQSSFTAQVLMVLAVLVTIPVQFVVLAATTQAVSQAYLGNPITILGAYQAIRGRTMAFVGTMVVVTLIIVAGFLACLIPGVYFAFWYVFVSEVFIIEGLAGGAARKRSRELFRGNENRVVILGILTLLLSWVAQWALVFPVAFLTGQSEGLLIGLLQGVAQTLASPIQVIAFVLLYYDIRVRKEGFDLELLAQSLGQSPAPAAPPTDGTPVV